MSEGNGVSPFKRHCIYSGISLCHAGTHLYPCPLSSYHPQKMWEENQGKQCAYSVIWPHLCFLLWNSNLASRRFQRLPDFVFARADRWRMTQDTQEMREERQPVAPTLPLAIRTVGSWQPTAPGSDFCRKLGLKNIFKGVLASCLKPRSKPYSKPLQP